MSANYYTVNKGRLNNMSFNSGSHKLSAKKTTFMKQFLRILIAGTFVLGGWQVLSSGYLLAKAQLSQWLIADAWALTLKEGGNHKPWSWADTHPVAKLTVPSLNESSYILAGASGRNMAFGPAHVYGSGMPGELKSTVMGGHNDTHFSYLAEVKMGDELQMETQEGAFSYRVVDLRVVDSSKNKVNLLSQDQLILTTCYPFDALITGGSMRFQVTADRI